MAELLYQIFVDVDEEGNVRDNMVGINIIPDREYDFFFYQDVDIALNINNYKVEIVKFKPALVLRDDLPVEESTEETPAETPTEPSN